MSQIIVTDLMEKLANSVKVPKKFKGISFEQIIKKAKNDYFRSKKY